MSKRHRQLFTYESTTREIQFCGNPLLESDIKEIEKVLRKHVIPEKTERYYYESLIYAISNQRVNYEQAIKFLKQLHLLSLPEIKNANTIYEFAQATFQRWYDKNRFEPAYNYMDETGGIDKVVQQFHENPYETRERLTKITWIKHKTATLWYLNLGGDDPMLCLDVHVSRQLAGMGIPIRESIYQTQQRNGANKRKNREIISMTRKEYLETERNAIRLIMDSTLPEKFPEHVLNQEGKVNGAFISAMLWWAGVKTYRGNQPEQIRLFPEEIQHPYSKK